MSKLDIRNDELNEVLTINGYRFSYAVFESLTLFLPVGAVLRIEERRDGVITVSRLYEFEAKKDGQK